MQAAEELKFNCDGRRRCMQMINVTINGREVEVQEGTTILSAANLVGVDIPNFCHDERLGCADSEHCLTQGCRICSVEVENEDGLPTACNTGCTDGMVIRTESPAVVKARKEILLRILSTHPMDCMNCLKLGACKLQRSCERYGIEGPLYTVPYDHAPIEDSNRFYYAEPDKCIKCGKCVRVCTHLMGIGAIKMAQYGCVSKVIPSKGKTREESNCVHCGNCVSVCPVGALMPKFENKFRTWETRKVQTICAYCGVGCCLELLVRGDRVVGALPAYGIANEGLACVKGLFAFDFINHPARLTTPLIRDEQGELRPASWDEALGKVVEKMKAVRDEFGPDAIAGFASAKASNEDNYLFMKFIRAVIGTNNVDHCARLCHSSSVMGLAATLGSGAMSNPITDVRKADVIFITGSNTTEAHPVIGAFVRQAKKAGTKIIVADPIRIPLADEADIFLQFKPGTTVALSNGLLHVIFAEGLEDKEYIRENTVGEEELKEAVKDWTPEYTEKICGVPADDIVAAARMYASAGCASIIYSMGITQHLNGTDNVITLSNLALATGNLGHPGCGVNPLRGQNNVQGACDMGALPIVFSGYQPVADENVRKKFGDAWGVCLHDRPGMTMTQAIPAAYDGNVKLLYIMGENPAVADADSHHTIEALKRTFLIVQDIFLNETAEHADIVLPAACFAERDGVFVNSERRVQYFGKAVPPKGESRADWDILMDLSNRMGYKCHYNNAEAVFNEITSVTPSYGGMTYERIVENGGLCWPCPTTDHPGTPILHVGKPTKGKGELRAVKWEPSPETLSDEYPISLITNRILYHYHTRTMSAKSKSINSHVPDNFLQMSIEDAEALGIADGEMVRVSSPRGSILAPAVVTDVVEKGVAVMPFHWAEGANVLTDSERLDPVSKIPGLKLSGVKIEKINEGGCV
jgi:formate dehydrogenase major subunit